MTFIPNEEFYLKVAKGEVPKHSLIHKFGAALLTTTFAPITIDKVYQTPIAAVSLEVVSSATADALDDTGAHEYTFVGLDANWEEQTVVVAAHATDGLTAVAITGTWLRLYRWYVSKSGNYADASTGSHVGTLTVRVAGAGATWSTIPIVPFAVGQSQIGVYTIPTGYTAYLLSKNIFTDAGKTADIFFFQRPNADDVTTPFTGTMRMIEKEVATAGSLSFKPVTAKGPFIGPCDIGFMGKVAASDADCSVEFELLLVQD